MSAPHTTWPALPEATARVARAAFRRQGNVYLTIGDQLGALFDDVDFGCLYACDGQPALAPNLLALVSVFQFMENLPDRAAADAVRARIDWKYALHLELDAAGFDASVLSEFRERLTRHALAQDLFEGVLRRLQALDLLHAGGQQRTDATAVLAATRQLNRLQLVAESLRLALQALAAYRPDWLQAVALPHWYERYGQMLTDFRLPRRPAQQDALALAIGRDGFHLLDALQRPDVPSLAAGLPAVQVLTQVWQQQFEWQDDGPHWRAAASKPPAGQVVTTPHDPQVRFTAHDAETWVGFQTHWTETCDAERPHLITHVATTSSDTRDVEVLPQIQAALQRLALLPTTHYADSAYISGPNLQRSAQDYGVRLVGPPAPDVSWQARSPDGLALAQFQIDCAAQRAVCPQGQAASRWTTTTGEDGRPEVQIAFPPAVCQACAVRANCTRSTTGGRTLKLSAAHEVLQLARQTQRTAAFQQEYARRVGIEGTISALVRTQGAGRARYHGLGKTQVQNLLTAIAVNLHRAARWLLGDRPGTTRPPGLTCLAPAQLAP